jgi:hypothetical protein
MSRISLWRGLLGAALVAAGPVVSGCSKAPLPLVPVAGKVTYLGKPVADVSVQFVPDPAKNPQGQPAVGQTGADGAFRLQTPNHGNGALAGAYRVTVTGYPGRHTIPAKYSRHDKTPLGVEIPQGGKEDLQLKLEP